MIKGIATSSGVSIGKIYKFEKNSFHIDTELKSESIELDNKKFNDALDKTIEDIKQLKEKALNNLNKEEAQIFDAHLMMANDPTFIQEIKEKINEGYCASAATKIVSDKLIEVFNQMESEYFKERVHDFKDVADRLLCNILNVKLNDLSNIDEEVIILARDLKPSDTVHLNKKLVKGIVCESGSYTSHSCIISRSLCIPSIVGIDGIMDNIDNNTIAIIDGDEGIVIFNPSEEEIKEYTLKKEEYDRNQELLKEYIDKPCVTLDGHKTHISCNIGSKLDTESNFIKINGIGLFRTEHIYLKETSAFPSEDKQFNIYKEVLEKAGGQEVVVRTIDVGGDKQLDYFKFDTENNPFLGYRAIRLCLDRKDIFKPQVRALLRASVYGKLSIMFPMVATIDEFISAKQFVLDTKEELIKEGIKVSDDIRIGAMIEVPSSVMIASSLAKYADFFSIGSNDLVQYTMAADRTLKDVSYLYQPLNPSVLKLIKMTIDGGHKYNRFIGMCGEMSSNLEAIPLLLGMGLDDFSMFSSNICKCKKLINSLNYEECKKVADMALELETEQEVKDLLVKHNKQIHKNG